MDSSNRIYQIDLARAWRRPPTVATTRVLALSSGIFFTVGGLSPILFSPLFGKQIDLRAILAIASTGVLFGLVSFVFGKHLPRWYYFVSAFGGALLIDAGAIATGGREDALAIAALSVFVVCDAAFMFSLRAGVVLYFLTMACTTASLLYVHVSTGAVLMLNSTFLVAWAIAIWLTRSSDTLEEDALTGLLNRRGLELHLQEALHATGERAAPPCVAILDLDSFKQINDTQSHLAGDRLLAECADAWSKLLPADALLGRYGGDEFVLIFPAHSLDTAADITEVLRTATPGATASAGVAAWQPDDSASLLMSRADRALYDAKSGGRNRTVVHGASDRMGRELDAALRFGELRVHYQPVVRLDTRETDGYEALLRWQHPERGLLGPREFVAHAERDGHIHAIGRWVVEKVIDDLASGRLQPAETSLNASMHELRRSDYAAHVIEALDRHALPGKALIVEVTESAFGDDDPAILRNIVRLRRRGVRTAIDDFGAGYSSLRRVQSLPIDFIKLDGSMMQMIPEHGEHSPVLEALAAIAARLGVGLVAEWVETERQADVLRKLGIPLAQGWLFGRPRPL